MKVLFIGLGSIGQRHLRNLRRLYGDAVEITAYRVGGAKRTFSDTMQIRAQIDVEQEYQIKAFSDLTDALAQKPDATFITNVTRAHIPCALQVAQAGCHIFLEKPISDRMEGVEELKRIAEKQKIKVFVGFQNRYHPAIQMARNYLTDKKLGNIVSVHAEVGERLTTMHSYEDYKGTYMARRDLGGGVMLNQMIHEIDYLRLLLGEPSSVYALGSTGENNLAIDVDDCCDAVLNFSGLPVTLHADFYQYPPKRYVRIVGSQGTLEADIVNHQFVYSVHDEVQTVQFQGFNRNDMFVQELIDFLTCIKLDTEPNITLEDGIASLKIALAAKESVQCGGQVIRLGGVQ